MPEDLEGDDVPFLVGNVRGHVDLWIRGVVECGLAVRPRADRQRAVLLVVREVPEYMSFVRSKRNTSPDFIGSFSLKVYRIFNRQVTV